MERYAKMFNIHNEPHPSLLANSMHLRVVGLSYSSVAVEGFKQMKVALGNSLFQVLIRQYLYLWSSLNFASEAKISVCSFMSFSAYTSLACARLYDIKSLNDLRL